MPRKKEISKTYKKHEDVKDVERYCAMYPWYKKLMDDIHETLAARDKHCGYYHHTLGQARNRLT